MKEELKIAGTWFSSNNLTLNPDKYKARKQLDVLSRFRKILSRSTKMHLCKSFIIPHFSYSSSVWQDCLKADSKKTGKTERKSVEIHFQ